MTWLRALVGLLTLAGLVACGPIESSLEREPIVTEHPGAADGQEVPAATVPPPTSMPTVTRPTVDTPAPGTQEESVPMNATAPDSLDPNAQAMIERAKANLARQLGIEGSQIQVVDTEAVEWRDASLGCPQPGMMYAQVITPGFRIVLETNGHVYEYHADRGTTILLCHSLPSLKLPPPKSADDRTPWQPVDNNPTVGTP